MIQAIVKIGDHEDMVLNVIKGKFGFSNKSEAINFVIKRFEEELLEPELRPEYAKKLDRIKKGRHIKFSSIEELRKITS
ncbi:DUF2683 family protein [Candidatus Woesearchaeota archaeon]|nr:DUF2683 family protein [Candidatus Woesearchaeota archaeon]